jgi:hypothetical protein
MGHDTAPYYPIFNQLTDSESRRLQQSRVNTLMAFWFYTTHHLRDCIGCQNLFILNYWMQHAQLITTSNRTEEITLSLNDNFSLNCIHTKYIGCANIYKISITAVVELLAQAGYQKSNMLFRTSDL